VRGFPERGMSFSRDHTSGPRRRCSAARSLTINPPVGGADRWLNPAHHIAATSSPTIA
jgi:hypothetical protein